MDEPTTPAVRVERPAAGVVRLTLDRPQQRNALTESMGAALRAAVADVRADQQARCLVITGAGSAFCSGADLGVLGAAGDSWAERRQALSDYYRAFLDIRTLPIPSLAAVNGPAVGAGLNLALACDLRLAARGARLAASFVRVGIHPGGGCTWFLTRLVGPARTRELLLLGDAIDATRAEALGLVNRVVEAEELAAAALEWAVRLAEGPGPVLRDIRQAVELATDQSLEAVMAFETAAQAASLMTEDAREGWQAFREKRPPRFTGR